MAARASLVAARSSGTAAFSLCSTYLFNRVEHNEKLLCRRFVLQPMKLLLPLTHSILPYLTSQHNYYQNTSHSFTYGFGANCKDLARLIRLYFRSSPP